jgi:uncharacterized protein with PIN domain/sulfur carrier protein ThiS
VKTHTATIRMYAELNDFLPPARRKRAFPYEFHGHPAVKDAIEALGVPHPAVDLVLVNGTSVGFDHPLDDGDRVAVYPVFETLDITPLVRLRPAPLREPKFILDVHLGALARLLRLMGFDAVYENDLDDPAVVTRSLDEHRIILTRDRGLLKRGAVTHGYWVRRTDPLAQAREVVARFDLARQVRPFTRCLACSGRLRAVEPSAVRGEVPPRVAGAHDRFWRCDCCEKVYWRGSHTRRLRAKLAAVLGEGWSEVERQRS